MPTTAAATIFERLVAKIYNGTAQCDSTPCLDTGIIATKWLMELLSERGRTDVGLDLAFKTDFPSWGYMAAMNATTIWEHWEWMDGAGMNSHAHPALASVGAWFYRWVVGLRLDDWTLAGGANANYLRGFANVLMSPGCVTDPRVPSAASRVTTLHGQIEASWANTSTSLEIRLALPTGSKGGRIVIPAHMDPASVTVSEGGHPVWERGRALSPGAPSVAAAVEGGAVVLTVGSGQYTVVAR